MIVAAVRVNGVPAGHASHTSPASSTTTRAAASTRSRRRAGHHRAARRRARPPIPHRFATAIPTRYVVTFRHTPRTAGPAALGRAVLKPPAGRSIGEVSGPRMGPHHHTTTTAVPPGRGYHHTKDGMSS
ncbi:hypothetical protein GCM10010123_10090 [Pilimelia anulata]|uniref:Uncharacterized protein n=1 Tax=Pilimelia anulata TaxID=53371 RepID=A0A8J3B7L7_9ACTN|nr:hypothetical protein GCM10010123_10090 [Pilimelia anulata]